MSSLVRLAELGDEFDRLGQHELAEKIDGIIKLAADVDVNFEPGALDRPFDLEEQQRLLTVVFEHLVDLYYHTIPEIEYLAPFWDIIRSALESARIKTKKNIDDKTSAFDYAAYKKWSEDLGKLREKFAKWRQEELSKVRVLQERYLIVLPLKRLVHQLETLYKDDQALQAIETEWRRLLSIFDNIFEQTTAQIADVELKRNV